MASSVVADSSFGRALKAGIPVALILLGAELLDADWRVERGDHRIVLSWSAGAGERSIARPVRLATCFGSECGSWSVALELPRSSLGGNIVTLASGVASAIAGDCPEARKQASSLA